jgi:hypothetical protein
MDDAEEFVDHGEIQASAGHRALEASLLLAEGAPLEALASAEGALAARAELGITNDAMKQALEVGLEAAFELRDEVKVHELLAIVESVPPGHTSPYLRAIGARFGARRAAGQGDSVTASAGFVAAADLFRDMEMPFQLAVVELEHAEWLVADGRLDEAVQPAADARETFERLRAMPWLKRLDRLLQGAPQAVAE